MSNIGGNFKKTGLRLMTPNFTVFHWNICQVWAQLMLFAKKIRMHLGYNLKLKKIGQNCIQVSKFTLTENFCNFTVQSTLDLVKFLGSRVYFTKSKNFTISNTAKMDNCTCVLINYLLITSTSTELNTMDIQNSWLLYFSKVLFPIQWISLK